MPSLKDTIKKQREELPAHYENDMSVREVTGLVLKTQSELISAFIEEVDGVLSSVNWIEEPKSASGRLSELIEKLKENL